MIGKCECCEATTTLTAKRRGGIVLDLCRTCERRDVIGLLKTARWYPSSVPTARA